ncbi:MAG: Ldh family oxidoreductase [Thermomicrobiales bacterium]
MPSERSSAVSMSGAVAPYVETIARDGMIGIAMANAGAAVAPYGARTRVMGTNPIAWSVPGTDEDQPFALDIATAQIAEGKVRVARNKGVPVPPGVIVNKDGAPSLDPNDFYDGGALMAFGGHKGSGFSILAQLPLPWSGGDDPGPVENASRRQRSRRHRHRSRALSGVALTSSVTS